MKRIKSILSILMIVGLNFQASAEEQATAAAPVPIPAVTPPGSYSMVVSNSEGSDNFGVVVVYRNGKLFSFKYCPANLKNGNPTAVAQLNLNRFKDVNFFADSAKNQALARRLMTDPNCEVIGKSTYGFAKPFRVDGPDSYIKSYGWMAGPGDIASTAAGILALIKSRAAYKDIMAVRQANTTMNLKAILTSKELNRKNLKIAVASYLGLAASLIFTNELNSQNDALEILLASTLEMNYDSAIFFTEDSIQGYLEKLKKAIKLSVEEGNLKEF